MPHRYLELLSTPAVQAARERWSGKDFYARLTAGGPIQSDRLGADERGFIAARNGFYLASVSESGWPYVQFRGGPPGFLRVPDDKTLSWADLEGNKQYLTVGNVARDDRVSLFLMDYYNRARLKILGHLTFADEGGQRIARVAVEAIDWNCPRHIDVPS